MPDGQHSDNSQGLDPLSVMLGEMKSALALILRTQAEDRVSDATYRTFVHSEMAGLRDDVQKQNGDLREVKRDLAEVKPKVVTLEQRALMSKGAANIAVVISRVATIVWVILGGAILYIAQKLMGEGGVPPGH